MTILKRLGQKKPIIDCPIRWHSTCDMLFRLLGLKCFCEDMAASNSDLYTSLSQWTLFEKIAATLEPARRAAKSLQEQYLSMGDFYQIWINASWKFQSCLQHHFQHCCYEQ